MPCDVVHGPIVNLPILVDEDVAHFLDLWPWNMGRRRLQFFRNAITSLANYRETETDRFPSQHVGAEFHQVDAFDVGRCPARVVACVGEKLDEFPYHNGRADALTRSP